MVAYERDVDAFIFKSCQLLDAFPTARLTTKYRKSNDSSSFLTAKTYDVETGAVVKFRTDKTIELGRLMVGTAKITAKFSGKSIDEIKKPTEDVQMTDVDDNKKENVNLTDGREVATDAVVADAKPQPAAASKKKKKKGVVVTEKSRVLSSR